MLLKIKDWIIKLVFRFVRL